MDRQVHVYGLDTSCFYNQKEMFIHKLLNRNYVLRKKIQNKINKVKIKNNSNTDNNIKLLKNLLYNVNIRIKIHKNKLYREFKLSDKIRNLREEVLIDRNVISIFDSSLTRTIGISENTLTTDIMIVRTYFFDVIEDIIINGFMYKDEKYICFTASAGQIRTKKVVFIKEKLWEQHKNTLTCGLTIEDINKLGGANVNKYLSYLALTNSATDIWEDFNIEKSIVVDDMETEVEGFVDFIDDETYEIIPQKMKIPITHTDGCGMILPSICDKSMMVRLPWVKGLITPFPFDNFIKEANSDATPFNYGVIKDIYGKSHDILKEGIEVIFTKSQFKMWRFYQNELDKNGNIIKTGWELYIENYKKYNCQAGKCNEEETVFKNAKLNYQMLQTLIDISDSELKLIANESKNNILSIANNKKTMLNVLGVVKGNVNKNNIQKALEIYPELLNDPYNKEILKQTKKSLVKKGRSAKLDINGKYTFIIPDLYAYCEYLFLRDDDPKGLLKDKEVYCSLYPKEPKLDCLRSPHLYREHSIRNNVVNEDMGKWFITKGVYTSCHDLISKTLQFDNDGDKSLVVADKTIIAVAERNMKDIVPLYYNMRKANAEIISNETIYGGLKTAYTSGNIGMRSNNITKIWNSDDVNLEVIKLLCMESNFAIDSAKTLYEPIRPKDKKNMIEKYTKLKNPHFFYYAKNKNKDSSEYKTVNKFAKNNNSVVNRLEKIIPDPKINFKEIGLGQFDYKMLMNDPNIKLNDNVSKDIINKYAELDLKKHFMINLRYEDKVGNILYIYQNIKKQILDVNNDVNYVTDVLIKYLYDKKKSKFKTTLWECFGDIIVENLRRNIEKKNIYCAVCGCLIERTNNKIIYCEDCAKEINRQKTREKMKNIRNV